MVLIAESVKGRAVLPLLIQPSMLVASHLAALLQAGLSGGERPVMRDDRASRAFPAAIGGYGTRFTRALGPAQKGEVQMHKIIVNECMSFDGVAQSAGADEDTSHGIAHGGWHIPYMDDTALKWVAAYLAEAGGFLFGRRTYELLASLLAACQARRGRDRGAHEQVAQVRRVNDADTCAVPLDA